MIIIKSSIDTIIKLVSRGKDFSSLVDIFSTLEQRNSYLKLCAFSSMFILYSTNNINIFVSEYGQGATSIIIVLIIVRRIFDIITYNNINF